MALSANIFLFSMQPYCIPLPSTIHIQLSIFVFPNPSFLLTLSVSFPFRASHPLSIPPPVLLLSSSLILCPCDHACSESDCSLTTRWFHRNMNKKPAFSWRIGGQCRYKHSYRYWCVTLTVFMTNTGVEIRNSSYFKQICVNTPTSLITWVFDVDVHSFSTIV